MMDWIKNHLLPCYFKKYLGFDCPGCGMQRAFLKLFEGQVAESIGLYPPLIPLLVMYFILMVHLFFKIKNGAFILKYFFILNILLVLINFTYKTMQ